MSADLADLWSLEGRVAVVAGGGGGLGSATGAILLQAGAHVVSGDRADHPGPAGATSIVCDVTKRPDVDALIATAVAREGRLDIVVHAAGITRDARLSRMSDEDWHAVIATNLDSAFYLLRAAAPAMRESGGGAIVLISSINAERGKAGQANYGASKAAMNTLARTAAREFGRYDIRVNVVAPGWIDTPLTAALSGEIKQRALEETAVARLGRPDDVAGAVLFLCADISRHVTGQILRVDGGQLIG
jgi:NAD(P)-dependent dehydrogenase (short-subunit alcohol dehydrogenase family)